jgi:hypothetical protein
LNQGHHGGEVADDVLKCRNATWTSTLLYSTAIAGDFGHRKKLQRQERRERRQEGENNAILDLYPLPSFVRMIKSRKLKESRQVARIGEMKNTYELLVGRPKEGIAL